MEQQWIEKAMTGAGVVGMFRGYLLGEMLYIVDDKSQFERMRDALERSYEMYGDEMSEFDRGRIQRHALELGKKI